MTKDEYQLLIEATLKKITDVVYSADFDQVKTRCKEHYDFVVFIATDTLDKIDKHVNKCREYVAGLRDAIGKEPNQ